MHHLRPIALNFGEANQLPTEFRLFAAGWNETEKGRFLFDDAAAQAVMAAYESWGIGLVIDLEHQMLDERPQSDPTARDARGAGRLELRNGELWAVGVKWTPDGAERLTQKRQRFVSPAFAADPQTKRITKVVNVAITALPATHHTPALVAADGRGQMDIEAVKKALEAIKNGDLQACADLLQGMIAEAAAGTPAADPNAPPAEMAAQAPAADPNAAPKTEEASAPAADPNAPKDDEEKKAMTAASARLVRLTSKPSLVAALDEVEVWRASHIELETERQKLATERAVMESAERRALCIELVKLGAEFPSTVWTDAKTQTPKPRFSTMAIETLREHVADQRVARGGKAPTAPTPPSGDPTLAAGSKVFTTARGLVTLTASELEVCAETGAKPEVYALNKALRESQRGGK